MQRMLHYETQADADRALHEVAQTYSLQSDQNQQFSALQVNDHCREQAPIVNLHAFLCTSEGSKRRYVAHQIGAANPG